MKNFLIGIGAFCTVILHAQSFTVSTNHVTFSGSDSDNDIASPAWNPTINNLSGDTLTLRWVRVEENIPSWWRSSVCTQYICSSIPTDSATLTLLPGDQDMVYVHIYPYGFADTGNVVLKIFDVNNPSDSALVMFHADVATGITEHSSMSYLYADIFSHAVKFNSAEQGTWTLTDISGRILGSEKTQPGEEYSVVVPRSGVYFFTFVNGDGFVETHKLIL